MPQVGNKRFDYTPKGKEEAQAYAKKTGQPVASPKGLGRRPAGQTGNRSAQAKTLAQRMKMAQGMNRGKRTR